MLASHRTFVQSAWIRARLVLALAALPTALAAQQPPVDDLGGLDPKLVAAWEAAGAVLEMRGPGFTTISVADAPTAGAIPVFRFPGGSSPGQLATLPLPAVPFGLVLPGASFTNAVLASTGRFKNLRSLSLSSATNVTAASLRQVATLTQLQELSLSGTDVVDASLSMLVPLTALRYLSLAGTRVTAVGLRSVARLGQLENLSLPASAVTETGLAALVPLTRLRALTLASATVSRASWAALGRLPALRSLDLDEPGFNDASLAGIEALPRLEVLQLTNTSVTDKGLAPLRNLTVLRELLLTGTPVADNAMLDVATLSELRLLSVAQTQVTDAGLKHLVALSQLRELRLTTAPVTDAGMADVARLPRLEILRLGTNAKITDAGVKELVAAPELRTLVLGRGTEAILEQIGRMPRLTDVSVLISPPPPPPPAPRPGAAATAARPPSAAAAAALASGISTESMAQLARAQPSLRVNRLSMREAVADLTVSAARYIRDPAAKLAALEAARPDAPPGSDVDSEILRALVTSFPDRIDQISVSLDRTIAAIPARASPATRLANTLTATSLLVSRRILLDKVERLIREAFEPVPDNNLRARGIVALSGIHLARADSARAHAELDAGLARFAKTVSLTDVQTTLAYTTVLSSSADLNNRQRRDTVAARQYITLAALAALPPVRDTTLRRLYRTTLGGGSEARLDAAIIARHAEFLTRPAPVIDGFAEKYYFDDKHGLMPYRLLVPQGYDATKRYPVVVWLHGSGGVGLDNAAQIAGDQIPGTRTWLAPNNRSRYPALIVVPQSDGSWSTLAASTPTTASDPGAMVLGILKAVQAQYSVDSTRIYLAGQSLGGAGTWALLTRPSHPFAAAIVLCANASAAVQSLARNAAATPVWVFHGEKDGPASAREMVAAIKTAGGNPRYTEYAGMGHDIWIKTFQEPGLVDWLFAQRR